MFLCVFQSYLEPVYFYIYTVFSLQAVYVIALYLTAWLLSGSWLAGALTGVWYILNREVKCAFICKHEWYATCRPVLYTKW